MKFTIERKSAHAAMTALHGTVLSRTTIPILQNVLITARDGLLSLTVTDLDQCVTFAVADAQIAVEGATTVAFGKLRDIVGVSPQGGELAFSKADTRLSVMCGGSRYALPQLPASDFPVLSAEATAASFTIEARVLHRLLVAGGFAAASDKDARGYLRSVYLHTPTPDTIRVVSTDSFRFTYCEAAAPAGFAWERGTMLSPASAATIERLLSNVAPDAEVSVELAPERAVLGIGQATLVTKVIDGSYPAYDRVIPREFVAELTMDVDLLDTAIKRAQIMGDTRTGRVAMAIEPGTLRFRAANVDGGEAIDDVAIDYDGESIGLGVNGQWFRELLSYVTTESVILRFANFAGATSRETLAVTFRSTSDNPDWYGLLAPRAN
jgi:DNA polymerase-3 subunit beta